MKQRTTIAVSVIFFAAAPVLFAADIAAPQAITDTDRASAQQHYVKGLEFFEKGVPGQASLEWKTALQLDPGNKDAKSGREKLKSAPEDKSAAARQYNTEENPASLVGGYRGVTLPMSGDQLLYLKKGDRVDLLVTFEAVMGASAKEKSAGKNKPKETGAKQETAKDEHTEMVTATILQNVVVVNVVKPVKTDGTGAVELLVNPNEAQYAALSAARGKSVSITVRTPGDVELHPMEMASFRRLIK